METLPDLNIRLILAPVDFSDYSERALLYAAAVAERHQAQLIVLHVVETLPSGYELGRRSEWADAFEAGAREQATQKLNQLIAKIPSKSVDIWGEIAIGNPTEEIIEWARERRADLIIMATHGRTGLKHVFLGSVAEATIRHAPCPVLVAGQMRPDSSPSDWNKESRVRFDNVLVAIDFSPSSNEALRFAQALVDKTGATLVLTHVSPIHYPIGEYGALESPQLNAELFESGERRLRQLAERESRKNLLVKHEVKQGSAGAEIVTVAEQYNVDLIVAGTRGLTGFRHAFLGSTAEYLVRHARCPVLIVRQTAVFPPLGDEAATVRSTNADVAGEIIRTHAFLQTMPRDEVEIIVKDAAVVEFAPGEIIFRQGDYADNFYLIHEGRIALEGLTPEQNITIETIEAGDVLGWSWLFPPFAWHFQARAIDRTIALKLNAARILIASEANDRLGHHLTKRVAQVVIHRLQTTRKRLAEECHKVELAVGDIV